LPKGDKGGFQNFVDKISPHPSLPVYDRKRITKEGYESSKVFPEPITEELPRDTILP